MSKFALPLILLSYTVLAVAMSLIVPLGESPDEIDHFLYVRYLLEQRAFPVMHPVAADNETMEANQPPLFYLLNAAVTAPLPMTASADFPLNACFTFDPHDGGRAHFYLHQPAEQNVFSSDYLAFRAARLVSVLLGLITVWLAYRLGRQLVPGDERAGLLAAAFLAFNPQFVFMTASVNNDVLTAVLSAALVYISVQAAAQPTLRRFVVLGVLMGLSLLTKFALLAFWPLAMLSVALAAIRERYGVMRTPYSVSRIPQSAVRNFLLVLVLPVLIAGWWYVRAARLYGDPLAWDVHLQAKGAEVLRTAPLALADLREFVVIHFQSYWAWFGWLKIQAPGWVYGLLAVMVAAAVVGLALIAWGAIRNPKSQIRNFSLTAVFFNLLAVAAIYASLLRYIQTINWSGYQGRLAYGAAAPAAALLGLGWWRLGRGKGGNWWVMALPAAGLGMLALGSLLFLIRPAFPRPQVYQPGADAPRRCVRAAGLEVEALALVDGRPGTELLVEPWLYGLETAVSQPFQVQILGRDGQVVGQAAADLSWEAGELWQSSWVVPIEAAEPARGVVQFGPPGALQDIATVVIRPERPFIPQPQHPFQADFAGRLRLAGYDWQEGQITLYWQALAPLDADYTTFVHVLDAQGELMAQSDSQPQAGAYPTSVWSGGEFVSDEKEVAWPVGGERPLHVVVGVYLLETGERLPVDGTADVVTLFTQNETE